MDLSDFSKDTFDVKDWLNSVFELPEAQDNAEEFATSLVTKLESLIQEVSSSLENTAQQVIQNIPRVTREVETMRQEALLLQEQMNAVKEDVVKVERDSSQSMQTLLKIDHVKSCMQEACKALREADNWSTLSADVEQVFESGDINAISSKLIGMQNSLEILVDVPDYQERSQRLELLKDRLEAIISPQLIAAFSSQTNVADVAMVYMKIFKDIKRLHRLQKYYHNFQKNKLLQQWKQIIESDSEETITEWLNNFYDVLLSTWHSQMSVCNQLLLDIPAVEVLAELLVDTMGSLDPSLESCIDSALKNRTDKIQYLIELKQITDRLAKSLDVSVQAIDPNFLKNVHTVALAQTVYAPWRPYIERYAVLEENKLLSSLDTVNFQSGELEDVVRLLSDSVSKVFVFIQEADNRCHLLTHGCAYASLFQALKTFLKEYFQRFRYCQQSLKKAIKETSSKKLGDDWLAFQQSLQVMQIVGDVLIQLERLEQLLKSNLRETARKMSYFVIIDGDSDKAKNPFHAYDDVLLSHQMKRELQQVISRLQEDGNFHPLGEAVTLCKKMCSTFGSILVDSVLVQVKSHFQKVPLLKVWSEETTGAIMTDLPTFSLSPQEYITEIGQFLMTIPQHVEPFILQDNPALYLSLKSFKPPSSTDETCIGTVAEYLLEVLVNGVSDAYLESLLKISRLLPASLNQLITDIDYFCDVLDDLGLMSPMDMQHFLSLLKAKPEEFPSIIEGKPSHLVGSVKSMRGL